MLIINENQNIYCGLDSFSIEGGVIVFEIGEIFNFCICCGFGIRFCCAFVSFSLIVDEIGELKCEFANKDTVKMSGKMGGLKGGV